MGNGLHNERQCMLPKPMLAIRSIHRAGDLILLGSYGSKGSNNGVLGPRYYNIHGIWGLEPYYLGPWTLRESLKTE